MLAVFFALLAGVPDARAVLIDKIDAVVNSEVILRSDVERFEKTLSLRRELDPLFGIAEGMESGKAPSPKVLDFLIQERLIAQTFKIADADVEQEIQSVQRNNNLDKDQLADFLKTKGFTYDEYMDLMRTGLSKRNLLDREIRGRVNVSADDVRNYFYNMAMKSSTSATNLEYSLQLIAVSLSSFKTPKAAEETAQRALRSIQQGESFAEVARRVSDDSSAEQGGALGYFPLDQLAEPLRSAVRKLQIGSLSEVLKAPNRYLVVKLVDVRSNESQKLNEMREQIRENLAKDEYKKQLVIWADRARNNAYVRIND